MELRTTQAHSESARGTQFVFVTTPNNSTAAGIALTIDQDLSALFGGNVTVASGSYLKLGNAYVATPATSAGYMIIKDSGGTDRKVMVGT